MKFSKNLLPPTALFPRTVTEIMAALEHIQPGQIVVYHIGKLDSNRFGTSVDAITINQIGKKAYDLATGVKPRVDLTQLRQGSDAYAYMATGRHNRTRQV